MQVTVHSELPPQSWLVKVCDNEVHGLCGVNVELFNHGLVEGCWDGPFDEYGFRGAENFFGTGMVIEDSAVIFVTPTHTLEALYLLHGHDSLIASNSLAFLLEFSNLNLPVSINYGRRFATIALGIDKYEKTIFDIDGQKLLRIAYTNLSWCNRKLTFLEKRPPPRFGDYGEYHNYLLSTLRKTFDNGISQHHLEAWSPITSCSSGYDSTACAALLSSLGYRQAVTLMTSRGAAEDSGVQAAQALNLEIFQYAYDETGGARHKDFPEAEFLATGMGGEDYAYYKFEDRLKHKLFVTGFQGDAWDINVPPDSRLARTDISGSSMTEWRLRVGFIQVPVPFIGVLSRHDIYKIGRSDELAEFRLNNRYDKPIPRKIAEERGVPRNVFGQVKKAASILFCHSLRFMTPGSIQDLNDFRKKKFRGGALFYQQIRQGLYSTRLATLRISLKWLHKIFNTKLPVLWRLQSIWQTHGLKWNKLVVQIIVPDYNVFEHSSPLKSDLPFLWAISKIKSRYRIDEQQRP